MSNNWPIFHGIAAKEKYEAMIAAESSLHYQSSSDTEIKDLYWNTYGDVDTDFLIITACHNGKTWYGAIKSSIMVPKMIDRAIPYLNDGKCMFKIDVRDKITSNWLANEMFDYIKEEVS